MLFNLFKPYLGFFVFTLIFTSCSWWGGSDENKNRSKVVVIHNDNFQNECLSEVDDFFVKYFKGLTTAFDVKESVGCVSSSINTLFNNAQEKNAEKGFTRKELVNILSRVWGNKDKSFIRMNVEIMFLSKRLLVGGLEDGFSRSDLKKFNEFIPKLEVVLQSSNVKIKYWLYDRFDDVEEKEEAFSLLLENMKKIDLYRSEYKSTFSKSESYKLLKIIFGTKKLLKFEDLVLIGSDIVFGNKKAFVSSQKEIFQRISTSFEALSTMRSAQFKKGIFSGNGLSLVFDGVYKVFSSLNKWSKSDASYTLPTYKISALISEAYRFSGDEREIYPLAVTITQLVEKFFKTKELGSDSFSKVLDVLLSWYAGQREIVVNYNPKNSEFSFDEYNISEKNQIESLVILDSLRKTEKSYFFLKPDGTSQYIFNRGSRESLGKSTQYYDLSLKNLLAHISFRLYETYVSKNSLMSLNKVNASKEQLSELLLDIRPLALDMGITNPYSCSAADNFMMEANLFTNSGNGDEELSFIEGIELIYMSFSAGGISNKVYKTIDESCELPGMTYLGNAFMDRQCVKESLFKDKSTLISSFPEFSDYYGIISNDNTKADWDHRLGWAPGKSDSTPENLQNILFSIVNGCDDLNAPITKQEIQAIVGLSQYINNWFSLYDNTGQGLLGINYLWDDDHFDHVIDGAEAVELFRDRLGYYLTPDLGDGRLGNFTESVVRGLIKLNTRGRDIDRYRALLLLERARSFLGKDNHVFQKNFCKSIIKSVKEKAPIKYNSSLILKCDGTDIVNSKDSMRQVGPR